MLGSTLYSLLHSKIFIKQLPWLRHASKCWIIQVWFQIFWEHWPRYYHNSWQSGGSKVLTEWYEFKLKFEKFDNSRLLKAVMVINGCFTLCAAIQYRKYSKILLWARKSIPIFLIQILCSSLFYFSQNFILDPIHFLGFTIPYLTENYTDKIISRSYLFCFLQTSHLLSTF